MIYKLLKDLPGYSAGDYFEADPDNETQVMLPHLTSETLTASRFPDWFEPVDETPKRWRAKHQEYFYVTDKLFAVSTTDVGATADDDLYEVGNYFRTRKQAEAAADAIKACLDYVHTPYSSEGPRWTDLFHKIEAARSTAHLAVQDENS